MRACRQCARTLRALTAPPLALLAHAPWQIDGVAVDGLGLKDVAKLVLGPLGSAIDVVLRRPERHGAAEGSKLIRLSLVRGWGVTDESTWGRYCSGIFRSLRLVPCPAPQRDPRNTFRRAGCLQSCMGCDTGS